MATSIFVLSACSGSKAIEPEVGCEEIDQAGRNHLVDEYPSASIEAQSLYTGDEHELIKSAVEQFQDVASVDWRIVSAGFGLMGPDAVLPSYECTFKDDKQVRERVERLGVGPSTLTKKERIRAVASELGIPSAIRDWLACEPDVLFVTLGRDYLIATDGALLSVPDETRALAFAPRGTRDLIGACQWVPSTETEREALQTTVTRLKGRQLRNVATSISSADVLTSIQADKLRERSIRSGLSR
ncbi:hypothetical protein [Salinarchaeum laminariae]|uniref:hypothetical protein n=1 Tax=Salinarchaeum laminariae TaxID=869888 RepID=UPI0020C135F5|nr:hypothetical protein [Salinarchaeum laminariae]